jgi:methionyl-tRNA formyltransferase
MSAQQIHNRVRAFNPWPGTVAKFRGRICKILRTSWSGASQENESFDQHHPGATRHPSSAEEGSLLISKASLAVVCGDNTLLEILSIQPEGRKAVSGTDFSNGARMQPGEKFESLMDN